MDWLPDVFDNSALQSVSPETESRRHVLRGPMDDVVDNDYFTEQNEVTKLRWGAVSSRKTVSYSESEVEKSSPNEHRLKLRMPSSSYYDSLAICTAELSRATKQLEQAIEQHKEWIDSLPSLRVAQLQQMLDTMTDYSKRRILRDEIRKRRVSKPPSAPAVSADSKQNLTSPSVINELERLPINRSSFPFVKLQPVNRNAAESELDTPLNSHQNNGIVGCTVGDMEFVTKSNKVINSETTSPAPYAHISDEMELFRLLNATHDYFEKKRIRAAMRNLRQKQQDSGSSTILIPVPQRSVSHSVPCVSVTQPNSETAETTIEEIVDMARGQPSITAPQPEIKPQKASEELETIETAVPHMNTPSVRAFSPEIPHNEPGVSDKAVSSEADKVASSEEAPAEEMSADEVTTGGVPIEEAPTEETSPEEAPTEESSAEETSTEEASIDKVPTKDTPLEVTAEEVSAEEVSTSPDDEESAKAQDTSNEKHSQRPDSASTLPLAQPAIVVANDSTSHELPVDADLKKPHGSKVEDKSDIVIATSATRSGNVDGAQPEPETTPSSEHVSRKESQNNDELPMQLEDKTKVSPAKGSVSEPAKDVHTAVNRRRLKLLKPLSDKCCIDGEEVVLKFTVETNLSIEELDVQWFQNDHSLENSADFTWSSEETHDLESGHNQIVFQLTIREVFEEDAGDFACEVAALDDSQVFTESSCQLTVELPSTSDGDNADEVSEPSENADEPSSPIPHQNVQEPVLEKDDKITEPSPAETTTATPSRTVRFKEDTEAMITDKAPSTTSLAVSQRQATPVTSPVQPVERRWEPSVTKRLRDITIIDGAPLTLSCQFNCSTMDKNAVAIVTWFHDDRELTAEPGITIENDLLSGVCKVSLDEVLPDDDGDYICELVASWGSDSEKAIETTCKITVVELPKPHFVEPLTDLSGLESTNVVLYCRCDCGVPPAATGNPKIDIEWQQNDESVAISPENDISLEADLLNSGVIKLTLGDVERADAGLYTCRIRNSGGSAETSCRLTIIPKESKAKPVSSASRKGVADKTASSSKSSAPTTTSPDNLPAGDDDLSTINDVERLQEILQGCTTFDERKKVRDRIREIRKQQYDEKVAEMKRLAETSANDPYIRQKRSEMDQEKSQMDVDQKKMGSDSVSKTVEESDGTKSVRTVAQVDQKEKRVLLGKETKTSSASSTPETRRKPLATSDSADVAADKIVNELRDSDNLLGAKVNVKTETWSLKDGASVRKTEARREISSSPVSSKKTSKAGSPEKTPVSAGAEAPKSTPPEKHQPKAVELSAAAAPTKKPAGSTTTTKKSDSSSADNKPKRPGVFDRFKPGKNDDTESPTSSSANRPSPVSSSSGSDSNKETILRWVQDMVNEYPNVNVTNFSSSFTNGMAFAALIHRFNPDAFKFSLLVPSRRRGNLRLAFETIQKRTGIAPLIEVNEMVAMGAKPDWKCIFCFIQVIYQHYKNTAPPPLQV